MSDSSTSKQGADGTGPKGNGAAAEGARQFVLRRFYVKDMSFEAPNSPAIFSESGLDPEMKVNLRTSHRNLGDGGSEVVLHVTVHALAGQKTVFLVELQQAGAFQVTGFPPDETRAILGVACPNALFPYAREAVSSIVQRGGFAPILLQPIDFSALFAQAQANRATSAPPAGLA
jgi:preprotein translocase subunit SecB